MRVSILSGDLVGIIARETAPQRAVRNWSKQVGERSVYMGFLEKGVHTITCTPHYKVRVSYDASTFPLKTLVLYKKKVQVGQKCEQICFFKKTWFMKI